MRRYSLLVLSVGIVSAIIWLVVPQIVSAHSGTCPINNPDNYFGSGNHLCGCNYVSIDGVQSPQYDSCTCSINDAGHAYPCPPADTTAPTVSSVSSTKLNGTYGTSELISITVAFSETVNVTGTPQLQLETGTTDRIINYSSGTGTSILTFNYTVQSGDASSDLNYFSTSALTLNSGTIRDAASNNATLTLPTLTSTSSLAGQKDLVINTTPSSFTLNSTTSTTNPTTIGCLDQNKPSVTLSWQASTNAVSYEVWRGISASTINTLLTPTPISTTTYLDPTGTANAPSPHTTYYYYVIAKNASGVGTTSNTLTATSLWCDFDKPTAIIENVVDTCYSPTSWTTSKTIQASASDLTSGVSSVDFRLTDLTTNTVNTFPAISASGFWTANITRIPYLVEDHQYKIEVQAKDSADNLVPTDPSAPPNSSGFIGAKVFDFRSSCAGGSSTSTTTTTFACQQATTVEGGLISTPSLFGRFGNPSGQCVIDPHKAPVPTYELPSFTELKNKYYDQSKLSTPPDPAQIVTNGLVGYWRFEEGSGTIARNSATTGASLDGSITGALWTTSGKVGKALNFNGTDNLVRINNSPSLNSINIVSVSVWVKTSYNTSSPQNVFSNLFGGGGATISSGLSNTFAYTVNGSVNSATSVVDDRWHHLVTVWDGTNAHIYIDGVKKASGASTINPSTQTNQIGASCEGSSCYHFFRGTIDEIRIYNRILTDVEIQQLYAGIPVGSYKYTISCASGCNESYFNTGGSGEIKSSGLYFLDGSLTLGQTNPLSSQTNTAVIFINGDLSIKKDLIYGNNSSGIVFVVKGKVNIDKAVTRVDAVLISFAEGATDAYTICTASELDGSCPVGLITTNQLIINGSLISLSPDSNKTIRFRRNLTINTSPAEVINSQAKYTAILNNLFSSDLKVWSEVQD